MTEYKDYVNIESFNNTDNYNNNIRFRKKSSGLSGGAIAGIVIACVVVLILISLILMCLKKPRKGESENNSSSVVGLRTVDNFAE